MESPPQNGQAGRERGAGSPKDPSGCQLFKWCVAYFFLSELSNRTLNKFRASEDDFFGSFLFSNGTAKRSKNRQRSQQIHFSWNPFGRVSRMDAISNRNINPSCLTSGRRKAEKPPTCRREMEKQNFGICFRYKKLILVKDLWFRLKVYVVFIVPGELS